MAPRVRVPPDNRSYFVSDHTTYPFSDVLPRYSDYSTEFSDRESLPPHVESTEMAATMGRSRRCLTATAPRLEPRGALSLLLTVRSGRVGVALASRALPGGLQRARCAQSLALRLFSSGARPSGDDKERARRDEERTAAVLKRKLAVDVETARNLVRLAVEWEN